MTEAVCLELNIVFLRDTTCVIHVHVIESLLDATNDLGFAPC